MKFARTRDRLNFYTIDGDTTYLHLHNLSMELEIHQTLRALTPGHFVIGVPLLDLPDGTSSTNLRLPFRWNWEQQIKQVFWKRWSKDYPHQLHSRPKLSYQRTNLQVGDCLVIHDLQSPILLCKMGSVIQTYPGADQLVRVVNIRTNNGGLRNDPSQN
ncbi:DUF5641 domain-containing protein [Trichonephila clavipes]|nr:DUF5641 domain-containing protein [Trichonephila clavipes]